MRVLDILRPPLVAIDVGTAMTRISFGASGVVEQPSVVAERVDGTVVQRSTMRGGVVADMAGVAAVVEMLLGRPRRPWQRRPGAIVCAPTDVSMPEREALIEAVAAAGASVVAVVPEPLAGAIGAGIDVTSEYATAIVDIGEGVTDFAVLRNASVVWSQAKRIGCGTLRGAIRDWNELRGDTPMTDGAIESIVRNYCSDAARSENVETLLEPVIDDIASFIAAAFLQLPHDLAAEVIETGLHVTGGGAKLRRLVSLIEQRVGLPLNIAQEPLGAVIRGAGEMLRNRRLLEGR